MCFHDRFPLAAVKIYPGYHGYGLESSCAAELAETIQSLGLPLLVAIRLEDERNHPRLMQIAPVPVEEIIALARKHPGLTLIAQCANKLEAPALLKGGENLLCDLSWLDGAEGLEAAIEANGPGGSRFVFGSHAPFFYPEAARLRLIGSSLPEEKIQAIASDNLCRRIRPVSQTTPNL